MLSASSGALQFPALAILKLVVLGLPRAEAPEGVAQGREQAFVAPLLMQIIPVGKALGLLLLAEGRQDDLGFNHLGRFHRLGLADIAFGPVLQVMIIIAGNQNVGVGERVADCLGNGF